MLKEKKRSLDGSVVTLKMDNMSEVMGRMKSDSGDAYVVGKPKQVVAAGQNDDGTPRFGLAPFLVTNPDIDRVSISKSKVLAVAVSDSECAAGFVRMETQEESPKIVSEPSPEPEKPAGDGGDS